MCHVMLLQDHKRDQRWIGNGPALAKVAHPYLEYAKAAKNYSCEMLVSTGSDEFAPERRQWVRQK